MRRNKTNVMHLGEGVTATTTYGNTTGNVLGDGTEQTFGVNVRLTVDTPDTGRLYALSEQFTSEADIDAIYTASTDAEGNPTECLDFDTLRARALEVIDEERAQELESKIVDFESRVSDMRTSDKRRAGFTGGLGTAIALHTAEGLTSGWEVRHYVVGAIGGIATLFSFAYTNYEDSKPKAVNDAFNQVVVAAKVSRTASLLRRMKKTMYS